MEPYAGFEPAVGEIRALRTFRIGPGGHLYSLFSDVPWRDQHNSATCRFQPDAAVHATAAGRDPAEEWHAAPDPDCTCGFYAYGSEPAAQEYPHARNVLATVACWGRVVAGTRGLRAEHCRVEALWLSDAVPRELAEQVRSRYPSVAVYDDRTRMLREHPATDLDCYEAVSSPRPSRWQRGLTVAAFGAIAVGVLPVDWLGGPHAATVLWSVLAGLFLVVALPLSRRRGTDAVAHRRRLLCLSVVVWMLAPLAGLPGLLLFRLPLVELALLAVLHRRRFVRAANRFPALIG
jgi:hypothetical protein